MYYPCASVISRAGQALPWYGLEYDELEDPVTGWEEGDPVLMELPELNQAVYHEKDEDDPDEKYPVTMNQIIYELCGNRFPGNLDHFGPLQKKLDDFDQNDKERLFVLAACIAMDTADHQIEYSPVLLDFLHSEEKTDEEESMESLKQTVREQKQELEALQATAHRLQKMYAEQYRKYQNLEAKSEEDTKELAELRETFFCQNNDVQKEEKISITLPYEVKESTMVFGGHPSFGLYLVTDQRDVTL